MNPLPNILRKISHPSQLGPTVSLLKNVSVPKLNCEILLLLRNVLRISAQDLQQYSGLVIVYIVINHGLKMEYTESDWVKISGMFSDIIVTFFQHILNCQSSHFMNEKAFCNLVHHAAKFLLPIVDKVEYVRTTVMKNGFSPILSIVCLERMDFIIRKELFLLFKLILVKADYRLRKTIMNNSDQILSKLAELTLTCGDFEMQESIIEILVRFSCTSKQKLKKVMLWYQRYPQVIEFVEILDYNHFDTSCREFLNMLNESLASITKVITLPCVEAFANDLQLRKPNVDKFKELWVDFSITTGVIHLLCDSGGTAWLKIYVDRSNVKSILISSREKRNLQSSKQIFLELISPLKLKLHSSEKFVATLTLIFVEGPKFNSLAECFFQKCYAGIYKIGKKNTVDCKRKNQTPKCHQRNGVNPLHRDSRLPLLTSTPTPESPNLRTCNDKRNSFREKRDKIKVTLGQGKNGESSKPSTPNDRSSLISYFKKSDTLEADRKFKEMCEKKLGKIGLEKQHLIEKPPADRIDQGGDSNLSTTTQGSVKRPPEIANFNFKNTDNTSLISKFDKEESFNKNKVKDGIEDSAFQQQSEESPFILTTGRQFSSDKTSKLNQVCSETGQKTQQNFEDTVPQNKSEPKTSNLEKLKNLLLSGGLGNAKADGKETAKISTSFLDISSNKISTDSNNKHSQDLLKKPSENEKTNSLSSSEDSIKTTVKSRHSSQFIKRNINNPAVFGANLAATGNQLNDHSPGHSNDSLSEPKTKKPKLLRSPKLLKKNSESNSSLPRQINSTNPNLPKNKLFDLLRKTKDRTPDNSLKLSENAPTFEQLKSKDNIVSSDETSSNVICKSSINNQHNVKNSTNKDSTISREPLNPTKSLVSNNETFKGKENAKNIKRMSPDSDESLIFEGSGNKYQSKRAGFYRGSNRGLQLFSPNNSFHCRIPTKTYNGKNPHKPALKQLTPDKLFETLKQQKSKRDSDINAEGSIVTRKRKLFNPNDSFSELISEKMPENEKPKTAKEANPLSTSESSPTKPTRRSLRRNSKQNKETNNVSDDKIKNKSQKSLGETSSDLKMKTRKSCRGLKRMANYVEISSDDSFSVRSNDSKKQENNHKKLFKNQKQPVDIVISSSESPLASSQESQNKTKNNGIKSKVINRTSLSNKNKSNANRNAITTSNPQGPGLEALEGKQRLLSSGETMQIVSKTEGTSFSDFKETPVNNVKTKKSINNPYESSDKTSKSKLRDLEQNAIPSNSIKTTEGNLNTKQYSRKKDQTTSFLSLIHNLPSSEALREGEVSEMVQEEVAPAEERKSDSSLLELVAPPLHISNEDSRNNTQLSDKDEKINNSSKTSTGTQAEARAELDFLDNVITNLEKMSLGAERKKIIKEVGSLESSLKKVEMYTESSNKKLKQKCLDAKKSIETMKSNLENMLSSCDEFLQSFQTKMTDIKSTMTRLSNGVGNEQDIKLKVAEDIEKMCRERKNAIRIEKFV